MKVLNMALDGQLLPPPADHCQQCAVKHEPELPHNQDSLFWKYWFYRSVNGERWPSWHDAMAHCTPEMKAQWIAALKEHGVDVGPHP